MIEIYDLNDKLITRVSNQDQLDEFMDDNEFEYPEVIIKENGKKGNILLKTVNLSHPKGSC